MSLFEGFAPGSPQQWKALLDKESKSVDAFETLTRVRPGNLKVEPFAMPGLHPNVPHLRQRQPGWKILQCIQMTAPNWQNAVDAALAGGAEGLWLQGAVTAPHLDDIANKLSAKQMQAFMPASNAPVGSLPQGIHAIDNSLALSLQRPDAPSIVAAEMSSIDMAGLAELGASAVEELAFGMHALQQKVAKTAGPIRVEVSTGRDYYIELAKFRALRWLLERQFPGVEIEIIARMASFHLSATEPHTNLLRSTTGAMAAILGAADAVVLPPHDLLAVVHSPEDSQRFARGIQLVLRHEAHLHRVDDPAAGATFFEQLTAQLIQAVEDLRGQLTATSNDPAAQRAFMRKQIQATAAARAARLTATQDIVLGVNRFPLTPDAVSEALDKRFSPGEYPQEWRMASQASDARK